ncbi:MAG: NAD(P)H-hydrate dehydratase [Candidatus Methanoplasma sp.]|jgi:NAD(P)H-hydrate epimerase|nr:NAD(P)H-hydrate dehydratase [Candidatus Methanoplasma sp.]
MISSLDSSVIDANSEALGVGVPILMMNAGKAVVSTLTERFPGKKIAFVCGNGNNGGDGIAAAKMMDENNVAVYLLKPKGSIRSDFVKGMLSELTCQVKDFSEFEDRGYDVIIDCALGTGMAGEVRPPYDGFIKTANEFKGHVVSVDVPSGLGTSLSVRPDMTITFHDIKEGMNNENSGEIIVKEIGIPKEAYENVGPGDMLRYPIPAEDSHKGSNGRLLIIGGGPYYGAPAMSALAAMRVGVDIVRLAVPENCSLKIAAFSPVFIIDELPGNFLRPDRVRQLLELSERHDAVLIGPGVGTSDASSVAVREFVSSCKVPVVVDADGLTALGKDFVSKRGTILTPHLKEFEALGGNPNDTADSVKGLAERTGSVILLKGKIDHISDGGRVRHNTAGCPGMTSAGTGDVLSGIVAGLLSKGMTCFDAAALGAFISGRAGEYAFEAMSYGMTATDVIDAIPKVLKEYLR